MAIVNRDKNSSEQIEDVTVRVTSTVTAQTYILWEAPFPCQLLAAQQCANGLSGAPFHFLNNYRFVVGAGATTITGLHASVAVTTVATSGPQGFSVLVAGSTLTNFQKGDCLLLTTAVANTAVTDVAISFVVKKTQDIVSFYGFTF